MGWTYVWTSGYPTFTQEQILENATLLWNGLQGCGWTDEAIAGCMGNFEYESGGQFNIGQWQHGYRVGDWDNKNCGLGLGQWTPPSKLADYCGGRTEEACCNGDKQVHFTDEGNQWLTGLMNPDGTSTYYGFSGIPYFSNFSQYKASSAYTPEEMCLAFSVCWERGGASYTRKTMQTRQRNARKWYNMFGGQQTGFPITITVHGNGTAWASIGEVEVHRAEAGQRVELGAVAGKGDYFQLWSVDSPPSVELEYAVTVADNYFTMPSSSVFLTAQFTGETPTPPPVPPPPYVKPNYLPHRMPLWMYPSLRK